MTDVFDAINGRTSANNFDPTHVMTQAEITELAQLANQTPTSFNQQNWRLVAVNTPAAKSRLKAAAYNQPKVGDAAVTFVVVGKIGGYKDLPVLIKGGIKTLKEAEGHLAAVDGVMLGRVAYHEPMLLAMVDGRFFGDTGKPLELREVMVAMADYAERQLGQGARLNNITRHMLGLANARAGARTFRQILSVEAAKRGAGPDVILRAFDALEPELALAV